MELLDGYVYRKGVGRVMKRETFQISNLKCNSCALLIDGALEDTEGVISSETNYAKSLCVVEFEEEKINTEGVIRIIVDTGYTALPKP